MHASNLLKGVLEPRSLNSTSPKKQSMNAPRRDPRRDNPAVRGKRASSPDNALPAATIASKKSSPSPAKMACLCAPTKHAGSFRCRLHRLSQQHWGGRPLASTSSSNAASSSALPGLESVGNSVVREITVKRHPAPPSNFLSRNQVARPSRLRMVVVAAQTEEVLALAEDGAAPLINDGECEVYEGGCQLWGYNYLCKGVRSHGFKSHEKHHMTSSIRCLINHQILFVPHG